MSSKAEAMILAGKLILAIEDSIDMAEMIYDRVASTKDAYGKGEMAKYEDLMDDMQPIISEALKEIGEHTVYEGEQLAAKRKQQEERVKTVLEQFPFIYDRLDIDIAEVTDALFGGEK